jgi:anti-anti-sigma factor
VLQEHGFGETCKGGGIGVTFQCHIREEEEAAVVYPCGDMDLAAIPAFRQALRNAQETNRHIVVEMSQLRYIDSGGVRVLFFYSDMMRKSGRQLALVNVSPEVNRIMEIINARSICTFFHSLESALQSISLGD